MGLERKKGGHVSGFLVISSAYLEAKYKFLIRSS